MIDVYDGCKWVNVSSGTGSPGCPGQRPERCKMLVVVVVVVVVKRIIFFQLQQLNSLFSQPCSTGRLCMIVRWLCAWTNGLTPYCRRYPARCLQDYTVWALALEPLDFLWPTLLRSPVSLLAYYNYCSTTMLNMLFIDVWA